MIRIILTSHPRYSHLCILLHLPYFLSLCQRKQQDYLGLMPFWQIHVIYQYVVVDVLAVFKWNDAQDAIYLINMPFVMEYWERRISHLLHENFTIRTYIIRNQYTLILKQRTKINPLRLAPISIWFLLNCCLPDVTGNSENSGR